MNVSHARSQYEEFKALAPDAYDTVLALGKIAAKAGIDKQLLARRRCFRRANGRRWRGPRR